MGDLLLLLLLPLLLCVPPSLCDPPVSNVAVNKSASQSSTFDGTDNYLRPPLTYRASAALAVDGAPTKSYLDKTCAVTDWGRRLRCTVNPWWQVDLGNKYDVSNVTIYQRGEGETSCTNYGPLVVRVGDHVELPENRTIYYDCPVVSVPLSPPVTASTVNISIPRCSILLLCEVEVLAVPHVDECAPNPCQNGGTCKDGYMAYSCTCPSGYTGDICETDVDECLSAPCENGGSCEHGVDSYSCLCPPGYAGTDCGEACSGGSHGAGCVETCSPHCLESSDRGGQHCHHVTGHCLLQGGCRDGYQGPACTLHPAGGSSSRTGGVVTIAASLGAAIFLLAAGAVVVLLLRRRSSAKAGAGAEGGGEQEEQQEEEQQEEGEADDEDSQLGIDNAIYSDVTFDTTRITSAQLPAVVAKSREDPNFFAEDFQRLPRGLQRPHSAALHPGNEDKNRYRNIVPYDHSRVVLTALPGDPDSDYVNACFVRGYKDRKGYIAAQGPTHVTAEDFLRMIWEIGVTKVAMVTMPMEGSKVKCVQYWDDRRDAMFGAFTVRVTDVAEKKDVVIRRLRVQPQNGGARSVTHFLFTAWPDKDVPESPWPLIDFRDKVMTSSAHDKTPVLVHCSAGIGRTGTLLALDVLLQQLREEGEVDVFQTVASLRQDRLDMVQTLAQYAFLHEAALVGLCSAGRVVSLEAFTSDPVANSKSKIEKEYKALVLTVRRPAKAECTLAIQGDNRAHNRNQDILPRDDDAVYLKREVEGYTNYLNAVFLPSYEEERRYILTQTPLPSTLVNFWRAVVDFNVKAVVSLDTVQPDLSADVGEYVPLYQTPVQQGPLSLRLVKTEQCQGYVTRTIDVQLAEEATRRVQHFHVTTWSQRARVPSDPEVMVSLARAVLNWTPPRQGTILVHCREGGRRSGVYVAMSTLLERSRSDCEVAVPCVAGLLAAVRPQALPSKDQYAFLYCAMLGHADNSLLYENLPSRSRLGAADVTQQ